MSIKLQLDKIDKALQKKFESALEREVAEVVIKIGKEQVEKKVYETYVPVQYKRTGLLKESWHGLVSNGKLTVKNIRPSDGSGYIPKIIETGKGYSITGNPPYDYEQPRPFIQGTRDEMNSSGEHTEALKKGLERQGVKTR